MRAALIDYSPICVTHGLQPDLFVWLNPKPSTLTDGLQPDLSVWLGYLQHVLAPASSSQGTAGRMLSSKQEVNPKP
jgi:hypothetical protein